LTDCRYLRQGKKCISVINVAVPTCFIIFLLTRSGFDYDLNIGKNNNFDFVDKNTLLQKYVHVTPITLIPDIPSKSSKGVLKGV
jgi:hypothetical protein